MIPNLLDSPVVSSTSEGPTEHTPTTALPGDAVSLFASLLAGLKSPLVADGQVPVPDETAGNMVVLPGHRPAILLQDVLVAPEGVGTLLSGQHGQGGPWPAGAAAGPVALAPAMPEAAIGGQDGKPVAVVQSPTGHATLALGVVAGAVAQAAPPASSEEAQQAVVQGGQPTTITAMVHGAQVRPTLASDGLPGTSGHVQAGAEQRAQLGPSAETGQTAGYPRPVAAPAPGLAAVPVSDAVHPGIPTARSGMPGSVVPEGVPAAGSLPAGHPRPPVAVAVAADQVAASGQARTAQAVESLAEDAGDPASGAPAKPAGEVALPKQAAPEHMSMPAHDAAPEATAPSGQQSAPEPAAAPAHHAAAQSSAAPVHVLATGAVAAAADRPHAAMIDQIGKSPLEASAPDIASSRRIQGQVTRALLSGSGLNSGDQTLTLQLEPNHLGKVEVRLLARGDRLEVTFTAETPEAQQALREGSSDLIRSLAGRVDGRWQHVDVKVTDPADPRRDQAQQDQRDQDRPRDGRRESDQQERRRERRQNQ